MSSQAAQPSLVLTRRLADGTVEWIPLEIPARMPAATEAAYALIDRADYEAPETMVVQRQGADLVVQVQGTEALVLDGFFAVADVAFYPTPDIAGGAGPFSGSPLTPDSQVPAVPLAVEQVASSADDADDGDDDGAGDAGEVGDGGSAGGGTPLLWGGLALGGLGLAALAGGGGGSSGSSGDSSTGGGGTSSDNLAPDITSGATAAAIAENSGAGQVVYDANATDTSTVSYSLKPVDDAAAFSINANTGAVTLTDNPNFEAKSSYSFTVVATDAANNSSERAVSLAINNLDEVAPSITSGATATAIDENSSAGQVVYTATSTDSGDISTGSTIYSLRPVNDAAAFSINANTGAVTLTDNPDFETKSSYSFTVVATDNAGNSSQQAVSLTINDRDDSAPFITSGATAVPIDENSGSGQVIYTAAATDDGPVTYSLQAGGDAAAFSINPNTGAVTLTGDPDFETKSSYSFTVLATDAESNSSEQAVTLAINDIDEIPPVITSGAVAPAIDENSGAGQVVYDANATDAGTVTWSLAGADAGAFSIDPGNGEVSLTDDPDFESDPSYAFTVVATDAADNSSQQAVTLAINDLDENAPSVSSVALTSATGAQNNTLNAGDTVTVTVTMSENTIVNTAGGIPRIELNIGGSTVFANYVSGSGTASLNFQYVVQPGDTDNNGISIPSNGLQLNGGSMTDAAANAASLNHGPAPNNAAYLVDTTAPAITSGAVAPAIDENSGAGQVVYDANATDAGSVTWSLAGADAGAFSIDPDNGEVSLTDDPDFESDPSYAFTVVATDAAGNSSQQAVTLAINDLDENAPSVSSVALTSATGAQNNTLNAGDTVTVTVTMSENTIVNTAGGIPRIELNIGGSTVFANYVSGSGTASLNFQYVVQPGDTDNNGISIPSNGLQLNGGSMTDAAANAASLNHGPIADNAAYLVDTTAPAITSGAVAPAIDENSGAGQVVYDANATDAGSVTWRLAGADAGAFSIDPDNGEVSLTDDPDFESDPSYAFTVVATDAAGNSSQQAVTLAINDLDEIAPTLSSSTPADEATAVAVGANIVLTFSENVQAGSGSITISDGTDTRSININSGSQISISGNQVTIDPNSDLNADSTYSVQIDSGALTDEAGNDYAGISDDATLNFDTESSVDTSTVVFDLVQGSSSDHSSRTFQSGVSYDIYIRVDSNDATLSTAGGGPGTWGTWSGAANLGSDDRVILAGDGTAIQAPAGAVTQVTADSVAVAWQSSAATGGLLQGRTFFRATSGSTDNVALFAASFSGTTLGAAFSISMPAGILTSQGLV